MNEMYTTGTWIPKAGDEETFVAAWGEFASWASGQDGAGTLRLSRDLGDPTRFVSFGLWDSADSAHAWKAKPEFRERMGALQQHVELFEPAELGVIAAATDGELET